MRQDIPRRQVWMNVTDQSQRPLGVVTEHYTFLPELVAQSFNTFMELHGFNSASFNLSKQCAVKSVKCDKPRPLPQTLRVEVPRSHFLDKRATTKQSFVNWWHIHSTLLRNFTGLTAFHLI